MRPYEELKVFSGSAHPELAENIARYVGCPLGAELVGRFADGEVRVQVEESVRGADVFLIQPTCQPVNENLMELLIMADAFKRASAGRITAVIPYFGYARQDKKSTGREPITAKLVANLMTTAGVNRVIAVDLHADQLQGFFDIPVDHLTARWIFSDYFQRTNDLAGAVLVSPDTGGAKYVERMARQLQLPFAIINKRRPNVTDPEVTHVIGEVEGLRCIIVDDMITTGRSVASAVDALLKLGARPQITVAATHPVLVGASLEVLARPEITEIVIGDTIPLPKDFPLKPKTKVLSIAPLVAKAIINTHTHQSVSTLFRY
ncbi:MAG: ribose-phosphate pyrophosphokinase [Deinococcus sp.]|nr:ribose-phosphate pyrophosphokinase [Deinococcus sp.]